MLPVETQTVVISLWLETAVIVDMMLEACALVSLIQKFYPIQTPNLQCHPDDLTNLSPKYSYSDIHSLVTILILPH